MMVWNAARQKAMYLSKPNVTEAKGLAEFTSNGSGRRQIGQRTSYKAHGDTGAPVSVCGRKERGTPDIQPVSRQRDMH